MRIHGQRFIPLCSLWLYACAEDNAIPFIVVDFRTCCFAALADPCDKFTPLRDCETRKNGICRKIRAFCDRTCDIPFREVSHLFCLNAILIVFENRSRIPTKKKKPQSLTTTILQANSPTPL